MIYLRTEHYVDSPADVVVLETSTKARNVTGRGNDSIKVLYPGFYRCMKSYDNNKVGSIFVAESYESIEEHAPSRKGRIDLPSRQIHRVVNPPGRDRPVVIAGVCLYDPTVTRLTTRQIAPCAKNLLTWFWSQDKYLSIGMNLLGLRGQTGHRMNSVIDDHLDIWTPLEEAAIKAGRPEHSLYIHCLESSYLSEVQSQFWDGEFRKVITYAPWIPALEGIAEDQ